MRVAVLDLDRWCGVGWRVADYQLPRLTEAKPRRIDGEGLDAVGVVLGYPSHQTIAPVRVHARQRAHSGIEGGPWSTCPASLRAMGKTCNAERRWLHGLTVLVVLLSAGSSARQAARPSPTFLLRRVGVEVGQLRAHS